VIRDSGVAFGSLHFYADGKTSGLTAHRFGLVLEFHNSPEKLSTVIRYRVGKLDAISRNISWSSIRFSDIIGCNPAVAISNDGYVIVVYANQAYELGSHLYYRIGKIDPAGGRDQTIVWLTNAIYLGAGVHASIAMNSNNFIVMAHESATGDKRIYYEVGRLITVASSGNYHIRFDKWASDHDIGINPAIAMNDRNEVVAVRQLTNEPVVEYRRGIIFGSTIQLGQSRRYDDYAEYPAVALLNSGLVLEVNGTGQGVISRIGELSKVNAEEIEWSTPVKEFEMDFHAPALAISGDIPILSFDDGNSFVPKIYFTVGVAISKEGYVLVVGSNNSIKNGCGRRPSGSWGKPSPLD